MAKKSGAKRSARAAKTSARTGTASNRSGGTNLDRLLKANAIDPFHARALQSGVAKIETLTPEEVEALISAHQKVSPGKRWQPDPDGSIF